MCSAAAAGMVVVFWPRLLLGQRKKSERFEESKDGEYIVYEMVQGM